MGHAQHSSFRPMAEVPFCPARQLSEYKGKGASASREDNWHPWYFLHDSKQNRKELFQILANSFQLGCAGAERNSVARQQSRRRKSPGGHVR